MVFCCRSYRTKIAPLTGEIRTRQDVPPTTFRWGTFGFM